MKPRSLIISAFAALVLISMPARAAVTQNFPVPINITVFIPCANGGAGESILISGNLHFLTSTTFDQGGGFHFSQQANPQGVAGIGLTTGDNYRATGVNRQDVSSTSTGVVQFTMINRFDMIGQGPGNNFSVQETEHVTILADGTMTASFDNISITCK